jgi:hypothetical protein
MITSKQIIKLSEEYWGAKNVSGTYTIIYDNPTASDLKDLNLTMNTGNSRRVVRFIADRQYKKVYIWDAWNAHHTQMRPVLGFNSDSLSEYPLMDGYAILSSSNKLNIDDWGDFDTDWMVVNRANPKWSREIVPFLKSFFAANWSWLDRYIAGSSSFLNNCKQKFETRLKG